MGRITESGTAGFQADIHVVRVRELIARSTKLTCRIQDGVESGIRELPPDSHHERNALSDVHPFYPFD